MGLQGNAEDAPPRLERSPHPYHRHQQSQTKQTSSISSTPATQSALGTPSVEQQDFEWDSRLPRSQRQDSVNCSDSGSEADDERGTFTIALPAPPVRARKGLRGVTDEAVDVPPSEQLTFPDFMTRNEDNTNDIPVRLYKAFMGSPEDLQSTAKFRRSRKAEFLRRMTEAVLVMLISLSIILPSEMQPSRKLFVEALLAQTVVIAFLCALYILRLLLLPMTRESRLKIGSIIVPSTFDPAPLIYPTFFPLVIAAATLAGDPQIVLANCTMGLAALPGLLFPSLGMQGPLNLIQWAVSVLPINSLAKGNDDEMFTTLYPIFTTLIPPLHYLTTTSLLYPELRLLAISVINVGLFSTSPDMAILSIILWIGGLGVFLSCARVLKWNVALERIPKWRLRRPARSVKAKSDIRTVLQSLMQGLHLVDAGKDSPAKQPIEQDQGIGETEQIGGRASFSEGVGQDLLQEPQDKRNRSLSINLPTANPAKVRTPQLKPSNSRVLGRLSSSSSNWCYSMTPGQAERRKWLYACYTYAAVLAIVFGPVRLQVQTRALGGEEPIGWAIGYLFGGLDLVRETVIEYDMQGRIPLPVNAAYAKPHKGNWVQALRHDKLEMANTRLLLFGYWAGVVFSGVATVLWLSTSVEVDTRRKVFHGTMVLMLLPTAYVDPAFLSLGLVLVLTVFLLLDLIRAAQLRPLSKPLALFLTPYVDGRDLRGPVVVSHIFLLIGCAIPLWLSLAGMSRGGQGSWSGWEVATRDVSMVAGVVCVGMGDAAASLIGRRYGQHKWPWAGGKSLEGSLAFAAAVTAGLVAAKQWLEVGGWQQTWNDGSGAAVLVGKAWLAGCGASMTEAVLTGCNDNVVVPVVLWLLVRGLRV